MDNMDLKDIIYPKLTKVNNAYDMESIMGDGSHIIDKLCMLTNNTFCIKDPLQYLYTEYSVAGRLNNQYIAATRIFYCPEQKLYIAVGDGIISIVNRNDIYFKYLSHVKEITDIAAVININRAAGVSIVSTEEIIFDEAIKYILNKRKNVYNFIQKAAGIRIDQDKLMDYILPTMEPKIHSDLHISDKYRLLMIHV